MQINIKDIDENLHQAFRLLCVARHSNMRSELVRMITEEVEQASKVKGAVFGGLVDMSPKKPRRGKK